MKFSMFTISIFQIFNIPQRPRWTLVLRSVPFPFGLSTFSSLYIITTDDILFYSFAREELLSRYSSLGGNLFDLKFKFETSMN